MEKKKILVFTGAGVSAESGIKTFRDNQGLWNDYKPEDVASIEAWHNNPQLVIDFYNMRRNEMSGVIPNQGHIEIAKMEEFFDVTVVTQNVDDLHERAGSSRVIHLHGRMDEIKSSGNNEYIQPYDKDLKIGDLCPDGHQMRPNIVWFGENLNFMDIHLAQIAAEECEVCIIVGTSMQVSPAKDIPWITPELALIYYIDPGEVDFYIPKFRLKAKLFEHIKKVGTIGLPEVVASLKKIYIK